MVRIDRSSIDVRADRISGIHCYSNLPPSIGWRAVELRPKVTSWVTDQAGTRIARGMGERDVSEKFADDSKAKHQAIAARDGCLELSGPVSMRVHRVWAGSRRSAEANKAGHGPPHL